MLSSHVSSPAHPGIPRPVVVLDRWIYTLVPIAAFILDAPLGVFLLFLIKLLPLCLGDRWRLAGRLAPLLYRRTYAAAPKEDRRVLRFNALLVVTLLGGAQIAFVAQAPLLGWILAFAVAAANGIALLGFCVGCFLFFQLRMTRYRLFR